MENSSIIDSFLLSNPFHRGVVETGILVGSGILGLMFSWAKFSVPPVSNILGGILILSAFLFHCRSEKDHKQAHVKSEDISCIVTSGIYSKIRHPLYLSIIIVNIGIGLAFGIMMTFILALLTILHWIFTALKEEEALMKQFPDEYSKYKQMIRWRMIPWVF